MKKLMIASAVAALTAGVFADLCKIEDEATACQAYELTIKLKTLAPKTVKCKGGNSCKTTVDDCVSYYKTGNRSLKGLLWNCQSECDLQNAKFILWRTDKGFKHVVGEPLSMIDTNGDGKVDTYQANDWTSSLGYVWRFDKKGDKVSLVWAISGFQEGFWKSGMLINEFEDKNGTTANLSTYDLTFAGIGSFDKKKDIIKNVSGNVAGWVSGDPTILMCDYEYAAPVEICAEFDAICDDLDQTLADDKQEYAAYGTWKMKYSKKIAGGTKSVAAYVPSFAK